MTITFERTSPARLARLTVTIMGSICGVDHRHGDREQQRLEPLPLVGPLMTKTRAITTMKPSIDQVKPVMPLSKLVSSCFSEMILANTGPQSMHW